jgi:hypothetical protein
LHGVHEPCIESLDAIKGSCVARMSLLQPLGRVAVPAVERPQVILDERGFHLGPTDLWLVSALRFHDLPIIAFPE